MVGVRRSCRPVECGMADRVGWSDCFVGRVAVPTRASLGRSPPDDRKDRPSRFATARSSACSHRRIPRARLFRLSDIRPVCPAGDCGPSARRAIHALRSFTECLEPIETRSHSEGQSRRLAPMSGGVMLLDFAIYSYKPRWSHDGRGNRFARQRGQLTIVPLASVCSGWRAYEGIAGERCPITSISVQNRTCCFPSGPQRSGRTVPDQSSVEGRSIRFAWFGHRAARRSLSGRLPSTW